MYFHYELLLIFKKVRGCLYLLTRNILILNVLSKFSKFKFSLLVLNFIEIFKVHVNLFLITLKFIYHRK